ncbi:MAG: hypothetical protein IJD54_00055 [Clostridia bacterium]|nr:hypothetical protein [Clostridia bacterium]
MKRLTMKVKSLLIGCLLVVMALCVVATASLGGSAFATGAEKPIKMQGASIKLTTATSSEYGLRFETHVEKQTYGNIVRGADFKIGMLYYPTDMLSGELTVETSGAREWDMTDKYEEQTIGGAEYCVFKGYIRNMPAEEYDRQITARSYILNNGNYTYADAISRSSLEVARYDYNDNAEDRDTIETLYFTPYKDSKFISSDDNTTVKLNEDNTLNVSLNWKSTKEIRYTKTADTYKPGTYFMAEFVGQNFIPTIFFGVTEVGETLVESNNDYTNMGFTGIGLFAGGQNSVTRYVYRSNTTDTVSSFAHPKIYYNYGYLKGYVDNYGESAAEAVNKTHVLVMGAENVEDDIKIEHVLFEKNVETGELTVLEKITQIAEGKTLNKGSILFGSATNVQVNVNFKLYTPDTRTNILNKLDEVYNYEYSEPTISASDFVVSASNTTVTIGDNLTYNNTADDYYSITLPGANNMAFHYAKTTATYTSGTYIMSEFVGANMIPTIFFGVTDIGTTTFNTANDYLNLGLTGVGIYAGVQNASTKYVYRATSTETASNSAALQNYYNYGYFTGNNSYSTFTEAANAKTNTYVLVIGANQVTDGVNIEHILYHKAEEGLVLLEHVTQLVTGATLNTGSILLGTSTWGGVTPKFKLYQPNTKENILDMMTEFYGKELLSKANIEFSGGTHTTTDVEAGKVNITLNQNSSGQFAKTVTKYAPGTYALLEFAGNGAPMNIFFGVTTATTGLVDTFYCNGISGFGLNADTNWGTVGYTYVDGSRVTATKTGTGKFDKGYLYAWNNGEFNGAPAKNTEEWTAWIARNYVMLVGAVQDGADVKLEYTLWLNENGTLTEIQTMVFTFANQTLETGSIAFTSTYNLGGYVSNFNIYTPDTKANLNALMETLYTMPSAE